MSLPDLLELIGDYVDEVGRLNRITTLVVVDTALKQQLCDLWSPRRSEMSDSGIRLETSRGRMTDVTDLNCCVAAAAVRLYRGVMVYKTKVLELAGHAGFDNQQIRSEFEIKRSLDNPPLGWNKLKAVLDAEVHLDNTDKAALEAFILEPDSCGGHKGIGRDDFFIPAICRSDVGLTVTHHKIIADLCSVIAGNQAVHDRFVQLAAGMLHDGEWALATLVFNRHVKRLGRDSASPEFLRLLADATDQNVSWWSMKIGNFRFALTGAGLPGTPSSQKKARTWNGKYELDPNVVITTASSSIRDNDSGVAVREELNMPISLRPTTSGPFLHLEFASKLSDAGMHFDPSLVSTFVFSLIAKPFLLLTGGSGTGKTKLAELFARWLRGRDTNGYALVAVGADWTDNRNVLGFVNYLRRAGPSENSLPVYQSTAVLDLLLTAAADSGRGKASLPHFVILDEMNLSHAERYFADFLSAMESTKGELFLHNEGDEETLLATESGGVGRVPRTLKIPDNVFVIGTINVDETTYMFSPKVLDRANVIEFRMGSDALNAYLTAVDHGVKDVARSDDVNARGFLDLARKARSGVLSDFGSEHDRHLVENAIRSVFSIMEEARMAFGFRTVDEIMRYFQVDFAARGAPDEWNWELVFDNQVLQKVLPKLYGSKRRLEALLVRLARFCETGIVPSTTDSTPTHFLSNPVELRAASYKNSYKKLCEMIDAVRRDQFVSFIQ